jgi:hypothetical protein
VEREPCTARKRLGYRYSRYRCGGEKEIPYCIWRSHSSDYDEFFILGYNTVQSGERPNDVSCWFLASITFRPWLWWRHVNPKRLLTGAGLHGVTSKKRELYKRISVHTVNRTLIVHTLPTRRIIFRPLVVKMNYAGIYLEMFSFRHRHCYGTRKFTVVLTIPQCSTSHPHNLSARARTLQEIKCISQRHSYMPVIWSSSRVSVFINEVLITQQIKYDYTQEKVKVQLSLCLIKH